jgi:hypothetical protein
MNTLDGFGNIFGVLKRKPSIIIPPLFGIGTILLFNLVIFEYIANVRLGGIGWIPFAFDVIKWSVIFVISGWTALLMKYEDVNSEKVFSKAFANLFVFSTFMSFFTVAGFEMYLIPGMFILFFILYIPTYMVINGDSDTLNAFKGNARFIMEDAHVIHTLVSLVIITLLLLIPYAGEYLAAFFYMLWIPNIYISEKQEEQEEMKSDSTI